MKQDIIIAGVGGQGILSIAAAIAMAALEEGMFIKQSEVHGMSQRGGAVQSHLRISDKPVFSDLIAAGNADMIISVEPMEALRYLNFLKPDGWLITNIAPFKNIPNYPEIDVIIKELEKLNNRVLVNADEIALQLKSPQVSNMVLVGASALFLGTLTDRLPGVIKKLFTAKGNEMIELNLQAFKAGFNKTKSLKFA
jgi:indolepyruvate ferredoxin oxidoreductase, beta subunit